MAVVPSIAFIGIIGNSNNPLHTSLFPTTSTQLFAVPSPNPSQPPSQTPPAQPKPTYLLTPLSTSLLLSTTLDIFESRARANQLAGTNLSSDYGLLKNIDEQLSVYGFETNTGVKFVVGIDVRGRLEEGDESAEARRKRERKADNGGLGVREGEVKVIFRAIQQAYVRLLQNPFYDPDEHNPSTGRGGKKIESRKFINEMRRIGDQWRVGLTTL